VNLLPSTRALVIRRNVLLSIEESYLRFRDAVLV
jgi:hypothetical protein